MTIHTIGRSNKNTVLVKVHNQSTGDKSYTAYPYLLGDCHLLNTFYKKLYELNMSGVSGHSIVILSSTITNKNVEEIVDHYNSNNIFPSTIPVIINKSWFSVVKFKLEYLLRKK